MAFVVVVANRNQESNDHKTKSTVIFSHQATMVDQTRITNTSASRSITSRIPVSPIIRRHRSLSALDLHRRQQWSSSSYSHSHSSSLLTRRNNTQFKSNPYVGWFRHSPDTTMVKTSLFPRIPATTTKINMKKQFFSLIPQELPIWKKQQQVFLSNVLMRNGGMNVLRRRLAREDLIAKFIHEESMMLSKGFCNKDMQDYHVRQLTELLNGRLRGGGTTGSSILPLDPYDYHCHGKNNDIHRHDDDDDDELNFDATLSSSTAHLLTRFAYWLLLPFQDDEAAEEQDDDEHDDDNHNGTDRHHPQGGVDPTKNMPSSSSSCFSDDDDDNDSLDDYDYDPSANQHSLLSPPSIDIGISSQAEAYYAHYSSSRHQHAHSHHDHPHDQDLSRLDYVITQMDILRMQRNASRHLDVESIYQLPTQTYYSNKKNPGETNNFTEQQQQEHQESVSSCTTSTTAQEDSRDGHDESTRNEQEESIISTTTMATTAPAMTPAAEGWSWMLVPTTIPEDANTKKGSSSSSSSTSSLERQGNTNNKDEDCHRQEHDGHVVVDDDGDNRLDPEQQEEEEEQHVCVICLEHFVNGDRLRVLPCRHKFHVGCIDRWLSGSSSFQDCHTAGCPTCKKRPQVILSGYNEDAAAAGDWSSHSDGSLPGWAFAQLGSVMAAANADTAHH